MSDDLINALMQHYGYGYEPAGPTGDPNSLGYALRGPAAPMDTSNVLGTMASQQTAKEREPYDAFARIVATLGGLWASAPAGALGANAIRRKPTAGTTPLSQRAAALEQGREQFHATGPTSSEGARLEYNSPFRAFQEQDLGMSHPTSGFRKWDPYYRAVTKDFPEAQLPTRALAQDKNGRFYDKNRLNAIPGILANELDSLVRK